MFPRRLHLESEAWSHNLISNRHRENPSSVEATRLSFTRCGKGSHPVSKLRTNESCIFQRFCKVWSRNEIDTALKAVVMMLHIVWWRYQRLHLNIIPFRTLNTAKARAFITLDDDDAFLPKKSGHPVGGSFYSILKLVNSINTPALFGNK